MPPQNNLAGTTFPKRCLQRVVGRPYPQFADALPPGGAPGRELRLRKEDVLAALRVPPGEEGGAAVIATLACLVYLL